MTTEDQPVKNLPPDHELISNLLKDHRDIQEAYRTLRAAQQLHLTAGAVLMQLFEAEGVRDPVMGLRAITQELMKQSQKTPMDLHELWAEMGQVVSKFIPELKANRETTEIVT